MKVTEWLFFFLNNLLASSRAITGCKLSSGLLSSSTSCVNSTYPAFQVYAMIWVPDSSFLYAGLSSGDLVAYTNDQNNLLNYWGTLFSIGQNQSFTSLILSADWSYLYGGTFITPSAGSIYQWNRQFLSGSISFLAAPISVGTAVYSMVFDPSNSLLYVLGGASLVVFQRTNFGTLVTPAIFSVSHPTITAPFGALSALVMSGETFQRSLYTCDNTGSVRMYICADSTGEISLAGILSGTYCTALALSPSWENLYLYNSSKGNVELYKRLLPCQAGQSRGSDGICKECPPNFYAATAGSVCIACPSGYYKPASPGLLNNSYFDYDTVSDVSISLSNWTQFGTVWIVNSGYQYAMPSQSGTNFVALEFAGSGISQTVYPQGSSSFHLTFYAANYGNPGGMAPLAVYAGSKVLGYVSPPVGAWMQYQFQFSISAAFSSFSLQFVVGTVNSGDVTVFIDTIVLLSNNCIPCSVVSCPSGSYLSSLPCGGSESCVNCPFGYAGPGGTAPCYECPVGTFAPVGAASCFSCASNCSAGYYLSGSCSVGSAAPATCMLCPSSSYCLGGTSTPVPCPAGLYSISGSTSLSACILPPFGGLVCTCCSHIIISLWNLIIITSILHKFAVIHLL